MRSYGYLRVVFGRRPTNARPVATQGNINLPGKEAQEIAVISVENAVF